MKNMVYRIRKKGEVLYSGEYKGHKFAIINLCIHPSAYIENKIGITDYDDCRLDNVDVHGGFTYCYTGYWNEESNKISWLGWDYAHSGDYIYGNTLSGKQWSTSEIYDEVKSVIDQIIAVEEYSDSPEYKAIRDMMLAAENDDSDIQHACKKLYTAGYRKQSDTAREILQMIKDKGLFRYGGYLLHDSDFDAIGKLYGVEVEE